MGVFGGLDVDAWESSTCWLWRWSNLRFIGFYLNHGNYPPAGSNWTTHLFDLTDTGWAVWPLWLPFGDKQILALMPVSDGGADGRTAAAAADGAGLERGATIYLDVEAEMFRGGLRDARGRLTGAARYLIDWMTAVRRAGFGAGVYASWLDATPEALLSRELDDYRPALWPFVSSNTPRASWDPDTFQLAPRLPSAWPINVPGWPAPADQTWPGSARVVGCQYDQDQRGTALNWPTRDGRRAQGHSRSVDWDSAKVHDPAHPFADGTVAIAASWGNPDFLDVFTVRHDGIDLTSRGRAPTLPTGMTLDRGPGDIGPAPTQSEDGFDRSAAATSRDSGYSDLFVLGLDGLVRTVYRNPGESYPRHPWALNPKAGDQARRASPLAAVSRTQNQIDLFYVDRAHRLVTQWWNPQATDWSRSRRVLSGPLVAGGTTLAALPSPAEFANTPPAVIPNRLDVFYVSFDYTDPALADTWGVVHAQWSPAADWTMAAIPGLTGVAAASGVAVTRDSTGTVHVVVQTRDRAATRHALLAPNAAWGVGAGPQFPRPATPDARPDQWTTLHLACLRDALVLAGMTRSGSLAWCTWKGGDSPAPGWSAVSLSPPQPDTQGFPSSHFSTGARLLLARRGPSDLDILGITETGELTMRTLHVDDRGTALLAAP